MYTIVDIETSGGKYGEEKITEIALYKFDGKEIVDSFSTLINPEKPIDSFVQKLTGITDKMVKRSPKFPEVAKRIIEITEGTTFVAHNSSFDYRMLKQEFRDLGYTFTRNTLCTIKLAKHLIPGQESYSLTKLSKALGIPHTSQHRAFGDAMTTVELFKLLLEKDTEKEIIENSISNKAYSKFGPRIIAMLDDLPRKAGLFYIHNINGKIIYIGATANINNCMHNIFTGKSTLSQKIQQKTDKISYEETGSIWIAKLKLIEEKHKLKPKLNKWDRKYKKKDSNVDYPLTDMLIYDKGRKANERSYFVIKDNTFQGYGYFTLDNQIATEDKRLSRLTPIKETPQIKEIVLKLIEKKEKLAENFS